MSRKSKTSARKSSVKADAKVKAETKTPRPEKTDLQLLAATINKLERARLKKGMSKREANERADKRFEKRQAAIDNANETGADDKQLKRLDKLDVSIGKISIRLERAQILLEKKKDLREKLESGNVEERLTKLNNARRKFVTSLMNPASSDTVTTLEAEVKTLAEKCNIGN